MDSTTAIKLLRRDAEALKILGSPESDPDYIVCLFAIKAIQDRDRLAEENRALRERIISALDWLEIHFRGAAQVDGVIDILEPEEEEKDDKRRGD